MEGTLSKALQKYYTRKGNRLIFSNGMTLNQLAMEMWERLGYQGIDASVISRVLNGERLFTSIQLEVFSEILKLSKSEKERLYEVLFVEMSKRFGMERIIFLGNSRYVLNLVEDNIAKIRRVRLGDSTYLASEWANSIYEVIHKQLKSEIKEVERIKWLSLLSSLITEQIKINLGLSYSKDLGTSVFDLSKELKNIGTALGDKEIIGTAYSFEGAVYYVLKDYKKAIVNYNKALRLIDSLYMRQFPLRVLALCNAYDNNRIGFSKVRKEILKNIENFLLHEQCELYEALGRGEALLGEQATSVEMLQKGWGIHQKLEFDKPEYRIARKIQLTRTQIEVASLIKDKSSIIKSESIGKEAVDLSSQFGYLTYVEKISKLLNKSLN